jgi:hypothetical protein
MSEADGAGRIRLALQAGGITSEPCYQAWLGEPDANTEQRTASGCKASLMARRLDATCAHLHEISVDNSGGLPYKTR